MDRPRSLWLAALLLSSTAAAAQQPEPPLYEGKPLAEWIHAVDRGPWYEANKALEVLARVGSEASAAMPAVARAVRNERLRMAALAVVEVLGPAATAAIPDLMKMIDRKHTRAAIIRALGKIGPAAVEQAERKLRRYAKDPKFSIVALDALESMGVDTLPLLVVNLRDFETRGHALTRLLSTSGDSKSLRAELLKVLAYHPKLSVPLFGVKTRAQQLREAKAIAQFKKKRQTATGHRKLAAQLLGIIGPGNQAIAKLARATKDRDAGVSHAAFWALTRGGNAAVPHLLRALKGTPTRHSELLMTALESLGPDAARALSSLKSIANRLGHPLEERAGQAIVNIEDSIELLDKVNSQNAKVRRQAVLALADYGDSAVPSLLAVLQGEEDELKLALIKKLAGATPRFGRSAVSFPRVAPPMLPGKPFAPVLAEMLSTAKAPEMAAAACALLGQIGLPDVAAALPAIERFATQEGGDSLTKLEAMNALVMLGRPLPVSLQTVRAVFDMVKDKRASASALRMLGSLGQKASVATPWLIELFGAPETTDRHPITATLVQIGDGAVPPLTRALEHDNALVRAWSAFTLGKFGARAASARDALTKAASDAEESVRTMATQALRQIDK